MVLSIKNRETDRLARELAQRRRQTITAAVTEALHRELERERRIVQRGEEIDEKLRRIDQIVQDVKQLPLLLDGDIAR